MSLTREDLPQRGLLGVRYEDGAIVEYRAIVELIGRTSDEVIEGGKIFSAAELVRPPVQIARNKWRGRFIVTVRNKKEADVVKRFAEHTKEGEEA